MSSLRLKSLLKQEVETLPSSQILTTCGNFIVVIAYYNQIPNLILEIGKLRELSFQKAGYSSGKKIDIDVFDRDYLHLFIWNHVTLEVVGSYRLKLINKYVQSSSKFPKFYSETLFQFSSAFFKYALPSVELGRSFIIPKYQKKFFPLMLLLRGISIFLNQYSDYKFLFGSVSISSKYSILSQEIILNYLMSHHSYPDLFATATPRNYFRFKLSKYSILPSPQSINELNHIISKTDPVYKAIPILLKHYLKLGSKVIAFNIDPNFSNSIDVLSLIDITNIDRNLFHKYFKNFKY